MMITGITVLALAFCMPQLRAVDKPDFEKLLPIVLSQYVPVGVVGFLLAGLMAAFMSNFAATINAAPAYIVNDIYKRFINPNSSGRPNVLKWYWWRFNGYGYFWGMMTSIISAMIVPELAVKLVGHDINPLYTFPVIFSLSVVGCLLNWYDKLEKAPAGSARSAQPLPAQTTTL